MQAYGWSLPAKYSAEVAEGGKSLVSVPVPVYCRPLNLNDPGMKVNIGVFKFLTKVAQRHFTLVHACHLCENELWNFLFVIIVHCLYCKY